MTAVDATPPNGDESAAGRRTAARAAYRASLEQGVPLTGAELGRRFGLSARWGRNRVAEVHAEAVGRTNGDHGESRHGPDVPGEGRFQPYRAASPRNGQAHLTEPGVDSARRNTDGAGPDSARRARSERSVGREASTAVTPAVRGITTLAVLAVAIVAAVASYDHQRALAELAGEGWRSWLLPVSVDGLVVAASM